MSAVEKEGCVALGLVLGIAAFLLGILFTLGAFLLWFIFS